MSSKTNDAAGMAAFLARNFTVRFLCLRQFQNRISDSVYTIVKQKIEEAGWVDEFDIGVSTIVHRATGSEFLFYGMARNLYDIKGIEGVDICWIEEGEGLTEEQWGVIDPTIRKDGSEVWIIWNPRLVTDFVQSKLPGLLGESCLIKHINYTDNPFLPEGAVAKADRMKAVDFEAYQHIYLGQPLSDSDSSVIRYEWLTAVIDAHVKLGIEVTGKRCVGYDVADSGADKNAAAIFDGAVLVGLDEWAAKDDELQQSTMRAWSHVAGGEMIYDCIGVGAHVGATLRAAGYSTGHFKFNAGSGVSNPNHEYANGIKIKDKLENRKAQAWDEVAMRVMHTYNAVAKGYDYDKDMIISISSDIPHLERLKIELATPRKRYSKRGLDMIETKDELARRGVSSPNLADAFIMGACAHLADRPQGFFR